MRPTAFPDRQRQSAQSQRIGSPLDALRCLRQATPALTSGDSLLLLLDQDQHLLAQIAVAADPFHLIGPPIQQVFQHAFRYRSSRILIATMHPSCRTGPFMPAEDHFHHAAKCSLAGQLLDLRLIDYLMCNETDSQSLLINFRDELYRYALQYSQQQAHPLLHEICPN